MHLRYTELYLVRPYTSVHFDVRREPSYEWVYWRPSLNPSLMCSETKCIRKETNHESQIGLESRLVARCLPIYSKWYDSISSLRYDSLIIDITSIRKMEPGNWNEFKILKYKKKNTLLFILDTRFKNKIDLTIWTICVFHVLNFHQGSYAKLRIV